MSKRQTESLRKDTRRPRRVIERELDFVLDGWDDDFSQINAQPQGIVCRLKADQEVYEVEDVPIPRLL